MDPAPNGRVEAGAPPFVILGQEALGLDSAPTDIHMMPDGRLLVVTLGQLVLGDGVRWEAIPRQQSEMALPGCAVDADGQIYFGSKGGFARVVFDDNGQWHTQFVAPWPAKEGRDRPVPLRMIEAGDDWLWHSESGSVISWRPGREARALGAAESIGGIFTFRGAMYISDLSDGHLVREKDGAIQNVFAPDQVTSKNTITSSIPFGEKLMLVGTEGRGLQLFDGQKMRPFRTRGILSGDGRINDLCALDKGFYVAAIENTGVVFFDRTGRAVQTLESSLDQRLAHVKRLLPAQGGSVWGLVDDGVLRIEFPARVSNFEPLIGVGVASPTVHRVDGDLWICSSEKMLRGVYDEDGRLARLVVDTPPGRFVSSFSSLPGRPVAGTERGAFFRAGAAWTPFAQETMDLRVLSPTPVDGRYLYGAVGEIGWMRPTDAGFDLERIPAPNLAHIHSSIVDGQGRVWLELGAGRVGLVTLTGGVPSLELFSGRDGLPNSWVRAFEIDGVANFNVANQWLRFDEPTRQFVPDAAFARLVSGLDDCNGRPMGDGLGRLWFTAKPGPQVLQEKGGVLSNLNERMPAGLQPWTYVPEAGGVVWMIGDRRLSRYDPAMPAAPPAPLRALITRVTFPGTNRTVFNAAGTLPSLSYAENSLAVHFVAPGHPFGEPVSFEVRVEGAGAGLSGVGGSGSAVFDRLKEGRYVLHVIPRSGNLLGQEATLGFTIRPPWYRTPVAFALYAASVLGVFGLSVWLVGLFHRRENARLERLVAERTAKLQASEAGVQASYDLLRSVIEATTDSIFVKDVAGRFRIINSAGARAYGRPASEIIGRSDAELSSPEAAQRLRTVDERVISSGEAQTQEEFLTVAGQPRAYFAAKSPLRDANGKIIGLVGVSRDITERKLADMALRKSEGRLQLEFELMPIACIVWGPDHRVQKWNPSAERIFGYTPDETLGKGAEDLIVPKGAPGTGEAFWMPGAAPARGAHHTTRNATKSGKVIWCEWTNAALTDDSGALLGVMSMVEDVTGRKALEEQLRQAQKMEVIGTLAGGVAHDFNNILTAMMLSLGELRQSAVPEAARSQLDDLQSMTRRAANLTRQLLVFARKQVMQFNTLNLNVVVGEVMKMLGRLLGEQVTVRMQSDATDAWVEADPGMLDQMVMNLCVNARDAMPEGGTLTLAITLVEFDAEGARARQEARPGRFACLRVTDTGIGMSPEVMEQIFEPFFTTKGVGQGTGLGLSSVYGIVHQHRGWIEVESAVGRGTTFRIYLPCAAGPSAPGVRAPAAAQAMRGTETILLVEDEEVVRKVATKMLERLGYRLLVAVDTPSAMRLWEEHSARVDLLLSDMVMPNGMTGLRLGETLRQSKPGLRIILMSGYSAEILKAKERWGANVGFLAKPFGSDDLARTVRQSLDGAAGPA